MTALPDFLLGRGPAPGAKLLRRHHLAAWACTAVAQSHPLRHELRDDLAALVGRHHALLEQLRPVLLAWSDAGVDGLLFKGMHLSAFVYPVPGTRFHGDIDVLLRPGQVEEAIGVARRLGWSVSSESAANGRPNAHNAAALTSPSRTCRIDLHRWALPGLEGANRAARRITEAMWSASRAERLDTATVRVPAPVDALLVGLVLQRAWADGWRLKPHDPVDFQLLRAQVTREALVARAAELRCTRTLELFLSRCDPDAGRLRMEGPGFLRQIAFDLLTFPEQGPGRALRRASRAPVALFWVARMLPGVLYARRALRRNSPLPELLQSLTPSQRPARGPMPRGQIARVVSGIRWSIRLLRLDPEGSCLLRSLACYRALRRRGLPVAFVSGVRRDSGHRIAGHAWVEVDGEVLAALGEPENRRLFHVTVRHPARADAGADTADARHGGLRGSNRG